ncbi:hypothetical protein ACP275_08G115000 [Erythranthe tilingii]
MLRLRRRTRKQSEVQESTVETNKLEAKSAAIDCVHIKADQYAFHSCSHVRRSFSSRAAVKDENDKNALDHAESSLRIVMFLSCWGPN